MKRISWLLLITAIFLIGSRAATDFVSTRPSTRIEYWQKRLADIGSELGRDDELSSVRIVFLGDSITDFWTMGDNLWFPGKKCGLKIWEESFAGRVPVNKAINLGVSGDRTEHVLYRVQPKSEGGLGELDSQTLKPEFIVLLVGINNSWATENPADESIFLGVKAVVAAVHARQPKAGIVLVSLLPTNDEAKNREIVLPVNRRLYAMASRRPHADFVSYLDLYSDFVDASGRQIPELFNDGLHPTEAGYAIWRDRLVARLIAKRSDRKE